MYVQEEWNDEDWAQLEVAASYAKTIKVEVDAANSDKGSRALAVGFHKNVMLREVKLTWVPEELVESVRGILCTNSALTITL